MTGPIIALLIYGAAGLVAAGAIAMRLGRFLNFRTLLISNYVLVGNISGAIHLSSIEQGYRGFYDVLSGGNDVLTVSTVGTILGLVAICLGSLWRLPKRGEQNSTEPRLSSREWSLLSIAVPLIFLLALPALIRMRAIADASAATRILSVDQGEARYVFMSHWFVWAICLGAVLVINSRFCRPPLFVATVTIIALAISALSMSWSGGRSIVIVMCLPLLILVSPRLRGVRWVSALILISAAVVYLSQLTVERTAGVRITSSAWSWADWEWGRYSMLGFAQDFVGTNGYLYGETFAAAGANILLGLMRLIGIYIPNPEWRSMPDITGAAILGNGDTYVVAGLNAELYVNFGYAGILLGMLILGMLAAWVDNRFVASPSQISKFAWAYVGTLLVFHTLAGDANAVGCYLLYSGLPVVLLGVLAATIRTRGTRVTAASEATAVGPRRYLSRFGR